MAVTASGIYIATIVDVFDDTQLGLDLSSETQLKVALFTNSITPNFSSDTAYGVSPYNANEVSGTGYTAGGATLTTTTFTGSSGSTTFDAADSSWASSTITNARAALIYADGLAGDNAVVLLNLGQDYSTSAGTFLLQYSGSGIFTVDWTP
ncbi:hypothetical protein FXF51_06030 [Nonomuraea sp. PA05]|uniref:hypothetical protein n=1 Tax=Nonomuraea sp. PA05 TaxID=2604466 RepID=UPI0011D5DB5F|nr:hypothetical protein [Nonomuraea sp. PA05]TYB69718.1 hypothetical protein FXF51_06030 [Nonomuraea sp. PA05]